jgi:hypothetical protein
VIGSIAPLSVRHPVAEIAPFAADPPAAAAAAAAQVLGGRTDHQTCAAALAPAAMSALIQAQETVAHDASPAARIETTRQIDRVLSQLDAAPAPSRPSPAASFSVQMLLAARHQLTQTFA